MIPMAAILISKKAADGQTAYAVQIHWTKRELASWMWQSRMVWDFVVLIKTSCSLKVRNFIFLEFFHLVFSVCGQPQTTETVINTSVGKEELMNLPRRMPDTGESFNSLRFISSQSSFSTCGRLVPRLPIGTEGHQCLYKIAWYLQPTCAWYPLYF